MAGTQDEVVLAPVRASLRDHGVEQELVVGPIERQHRGLHHGRVPGPRVRPRLPALRENRLECRYLLVERGCRRAPEGFYVPAQPRCLRGVARLQKRSFRVPQVGHDEHRVRVLVKPVGIVSSARRTSSRLISFPTTSSGTVGNSRCTARSSRERTVASPTPASKTRGAGGRGFSWAICSAAFAAMTCFSLHVVMNARYFCRLS
jgi:hypothetical protein